MYNLSMRFLFLAVSIICIFFTLLPAAAQTQEESLQHDENETIINPCFPILPLVRTVNGGIFKWHPVWPLEIPPDAFSLVSGKASSISLEISDKTFVCEWHHNGRLMQFPLFDNAVNQPAFRVLTQFNQSEEIENIILSGPSENESETVIEIEIMERQDDNVSLARIHLDGEYYFAVFHYRDDYASETWYDAEGFPHGVIVFESVTTTESINGNLESRITYNYNSWGNISNVDAEYMNISVSYNENSQPIYLKRSFLPEIDPSLSEENQLESRTEHLTFQWDERNLLVSLKGNFEDMIRETQDENASDTSESTAFPIAEKRFEYTLDDQGNWTERREILMIRYGAYLFPAEGLTIRRNIQYSTP